MDVSVWYKKPSHNELLERRIDNGWKPTPSQFKDGIRVEGFASCLF